MSEKKHSKRLILLDAHAILHRAYHALPDFATAKGEPTGALYGLSAMLIKIIEDLKPDYLVACYDLAGPTYRHEAYKDYKLGRKKAEDDLISQMKRSREIFEGLNIPIYDKQGFEADDIIGTIVEQELGRKKSGNKEGNGAGEDFEIIIASGDMDTMQLISENDVKVYTLKKGIKDTVMYNEKAVLERFGFGPKLIPDYKGLSGDASDNIVGVKGIGDKTATTLIMTFGTIENMYKELDAGHEEAFLKAGIKPRIIQLLKDNREEAEFSKMLATIRKDVPIDFQIPAKTFRESMDISKITALWTSLEFRTLGQRLNSVMSGSATKSVSVENKKGRSASKEITNGEDNEDTDSAKNNKVESNMALFEVIPKDEIEKVGVALWLINSNTTNPTIGDIINYAGVQDFTEAKKLIFHELEEKKLKSVYDNIEAPLLPVLRKMEKRGVKIDRTTLAELGKKYHEELSVLEKKIWQEAGMEFNINSPKQLGEVLFDQLGLKAKNMKKTSGGARSTRESELEKLRDLHPIVSHIFEYRELAKLLSTYIDAIPPLLDQESRLHTHFISSGTTTGRMASQEPNLQNIPIKSKLGKEIRKSFVAEDGCAFVGFDYSQMELRIAAFLSGDEKLINIFKNGEDVHTSVASFVFKVPQENVTSEMRRRAKVINFGIIYGMGVMALKQNLGTTREEAQTFLNDYFATFSTLASYLESVKKEAEEKGYTETFFGRRRYFEGINSRIPYIKAQAERMAINAPVQGTGADIIKLAMIKIDEYLRKERLDDQVFPLLQVHDELICEVKESLADRVSEEIVKIMESVIEPSQTKGVVLSAKAYKGKNWGDLK